MKSIFVIGDKIIDLKLVLAYFPNEADLAVSLEYQSSDNLVVAYLPNSVEYRHFVELCEIYTHRGDIPEPAPEPVPIPTKPDTKITLEVLQRILEGYLLVEDNVFKNGNTLPLNCDFNDLLPDSDLTLMFPSVESQFYVHAPTGWTSGLILVGNIGGLSYQLAMQSTVSRLHYRSYSPDEGWTEWTYFATDVSCQVLIQQALDNFHYVDGDFEVSGDLMVSGNIIQQGTSYETHAEKVYSKNDMIITRDGAVSALPTGEFSGIQAKVYDGEHDGVLGFDNQGTAYVGDIGDERPLVTRLPASQMVDGSPVKWDSSSQSLIPHSVDTIPEAGSDNLITSGAVASLIDDVYPSDSKVYSSHKIDSVYAKKSEVSDLIDDSKTTASNVWSAEKVNDTFIKETSVSGSIATWGGNWKAVKQGSVITVTATNIGYSTNIPTGQQPVLFNLPAGYRPNSAMVAVGNDGSGGWSHASSIGYNIGTNGNVEVYAYQTVGAYGASFSVSYCV